MEQFLHAAGVSGHHLQRRTASEEWPWIWSFDPVLNAKPGVQFMQCFVQLNQVTNAR
jgi:hypothetical protein